MLARLIQESHSTPRPLVLPDARAMGLAKQLIQPEKEKPKVVEPEIPVEVDLTDIRREAAEILAKGRTEADQILAEARQRAAEMERKAREQGINEARTRMVGEVANAVEPLRAQLTNSLTEVANLRHHMAASAENELVRLAIEIAKKIIHRDIAVDREIIVSLIKVALARVQESPAAMIRLHPEDYQYVATKKDQIARGRAIELIEDSSITKGGCLIETDLGNVDARIEQRFAEIEKGFLSL